MVGMSGGVDSSVAALLLQREGKEVAGMFMQNWEDDEPASACLSSRIPYHTEVTVERLRMIEKAEDVLRDLGFHVCRVRHHEQPARPDGAPAAPLARLEIGHDELARAFESGIRHRLVRELKAVGYGHVTIDLQGYRMGSLNEGLRLRPVQ